MLFSSFAGVFQSIKIKLNSLKQKTPANIFRERERSEGAAT